MPKVLIAGGGLAGLAAAAALDSAGYEVDLYESRAFLGGRATSFPVSSEDSEVIDNCQHVLLRCFTNLLDLYRRLGVDGKIEFHRKFHFIEPGGRRSVLRGRGLSFFGLKFLTWGEKWGIVQALRAIGREEPPAGATMLDWLKQKGQSPRAIGRFWNQVLVSAINEDLDRMAACHGFQVFRQGFLAGKDASQMGLAAVPLKELYNAAQLKHVRVHYRAPVERFEMNGGLVSAAFAWGERCKADYYISALPFERAGALLGLDVKGFEPSPITGIHLWFDRPVMDLPHATLLDRTIQWAFNKSEGRYVQLVVSASRSLLETARAEVIDLAVKELAEFFPQVKEAKLVKSQVIKEARATFSARPEVEALRPPARTKWPNLFLAGDWTRTGWPATMEGAVRSGYLAAEAVLKAAGNAQTFVLR